MDIWSDNVLVKFSLEKRAKMSPPPCSVYVYEGFCDMWRLILLSDGLDMIAREKVQASAYSYTNNIQINPMSHSS